MKVRVSNKTKFWILYNEVLRGMCPQQERIVKQIIKLVPLTRVWLHIKDRKRWGYSSYILIETLNDYTIRMSDSCIRFFHSQTPPDMCTIPEMVINEKVIIPNLVKIIKDTSIKIRTENLKAIKQFLRNKKPWNYIVLKSVRE